MARTERRPLLNENTLSTFTRRQFCKTTFAVGSFCLAESISAVGAQAFPPQQNQQTYDLLIQGGTVIDPSQNLNEQFDVAIAGGKIAGVAKNIPRSQAREVVSATGKIVCPGLIDIHAHVYENVGLQGLSPDRHYLARGVTTVVDAGSAGYTTVAGFRKYIAASSHARVYALVDIGTYGLIAGIQGALKNPANMQPKETAEAVRNNRPVTVGVKVRLSEGVAGTEDLEALRRTREAALGAGVPMMVHVGDTHSPLREILDMMRPRDILTHYLHPDRNGVLDGRGNILPEILEARQRGILFDVGHGSSHFAFRVGEQTIAQGFLPDTISSDVTTRTMNGPTFDTLTTLSKFFLIGMKVEDVIRTVTLNAARAFDYGVVLGTFRKGSDADVSILELRDGDFSFTDSHQDTRKGKQKLLPFLTIRSGSIFKPEQA
jgi:dihydroorotase